MSVLIRGAEPVSRDEYFLREGIFAKSSVSLITSLDGAGFDTTPPVMGGVGRDSSPNFFLSLEEGGRLELLLVWA